MKFLESEDFFVKLWQDNFGKSKIKLSCSLTIMLLLFQYIAAQNPQISLHAQKPTVYLNIGATAWRNWVPRGDPYTTLHTRYGSFASLAVGASLGRNAMVVFQPELEFDLYGSNYEWRNARESRHVEANVKLFYTCFSPGLAIRPVPQMDIRVGFPLMLATGGVGKYEVITTYFTEDTVSYTGHLREIRQSFNFGPEMSIGYFAQLRNGYAFGPRIVGFVSAKGLYKTELTPHSPRIFRLGLELVFRFPSKGRASN